MQTILTISNNPFPSYEQVPMPVVSTLVMDHYSCYLATCDVNIRVAVELWLNWGN